MDEEEVEDPEAANTEDESADVSQEEWASDEDAAEAEEAEGDLESEAEPASDQGGPGELTHFWADADAQLIQERAINVWL